MQEIDDELVSRAICWCSEAERPASPDQVRAALSPLSWDELLAARALLADPPPIRPLGPLALADLARGVGPELAAERERTRDMGALFPPHRLQDSRTGRRPRSGAEPAAPIRKKGKRAAAPLIRRVRDQVAPAPPPEPARLPLVNDLFASEGRTVLERLVREHGARRGRIAAALAAGWRRGDGNAPDEEELSRLLDAHGLARGFERRERDELLHALRAAAGLRSRAAGAVGIEPPAFDAALQRLGASREAESIRAAHRDELRRRATLSERVRMLLGEPERLADLDLLAEMEADVRERLPQLVRALQPSRAAPLGVALARSLAVGPRDIDALAHRLGLDLGGRRAPPSPAVGRPPPVDRPPRPGGERGRPLGRERRPRAAGQDRPGRGDLPAARDRSHQPRGVRPRPTLSPRATEGGGARPHRQRGPAKGPGRPKGPRPGRS